MGRAHSRLLDTLKIQTRQAKFGALVAWVRALEDREVLSRKLTELLARVPV